MPGDIESQGMLLLGLLLVGRNNNPTIHEWKKIESTWKGAPLGNLVRKEKSLLET